jgi:hypothetical protein
MLVMGYAADEGAYDVVEEGAVDEEFIGFHRWLGRSARVCEACLEAPSTGHADQVIKPYPKRSAGRRTVPCQAGWLAGWLVPIIREYLDRYPLPAETPVFANTVGKPLRRTLFLARVWRPALARAGMLGTLTVIGDNTVRAGWTDDTGAKLAKEFATSNVKTCGCGSVLPSF